MIMMTEEKAERTELHAEDDSLQVYLKDIANHRLLSREDEAEIFQRYESGDKTAREEIARCNLRLVVKIALQFRNLGVPMADLIQEGNIGLLHVIDKFDWRKGFRFSTYAAFWIRQEIQAYLRSTGTLVRLPVRKSRLIGKINETIRHFNNMEGRDPSAEEIALFLDIPEEKVSVMLGLRESVVSLDQEWNEEGSTLMNTLADGGPAPDAALLTEEMKRVVRASLVHLSDREREVIELRYGLKNDGKCHSLRKASKFVGLSQEGVRRIEHRALEKLRRPMVAGTMANLLTA